MRGCERKVIMLKGTDSEIFDEAYFLIRRDCKESDGREIVSEAQRIVNMNTTRRRHTSRKKKEAAAFFAGLFSGLAVGVILLMIF